MNMRMNKKIFFLCVVGFLTTGLLFAGDPTGLDKIANDINSYNAGIKKIVRAVLGLAAIGGGVYTYFKVQNDDGGSGKKAIGNYVLALIFGGIIFTIVEVFFG